MKGNQPISELNADTNCKLCRQYQERAHTHTQTHTRTHLWSRTFQPQTDQMTEILTARHMNPSHSNAEEIWSDKKQFRWTFSFCLLYVCRVWWCAFAFNGKLARTKLVGLKLPKPSTTSNNKNNSTIAQKKRSTDSDWKLQWTKWRCWMLAK